VKRINIIAINNRYGLSRSTDILQRILRNAGFKVTIKGYRHHPRKNLRIPIMAFMYAKLTIRRLLFRQRSYDINIFIEHIFNRWLPHACINILIPNPEWFRDKCHKYLAQIDYVLCNTKHTQQIFDKLGCKTEFIGFTSIDYLNESQDKSFEKFLHVAGQSLQKGTRTLIELWSKHPKWPTLTIIQHTSAKELVQINNINHITEYLNDALLKEYQNQNGVHLCPSESEGFGHYIVEAMSCKALVLTTNAPPMNELITNDRGILVDYQKSSPQRLGMNYYVDSQDLEKKIVQILGMDTSQKKKLGQNARKWYQDNDLFFRQRILYVIDKLLR
jgi:glycosyltransferase involved in cell wall biosynthesis